MLTREEIKQLIELTQWKTVAKDGEYAMIKKERGYHSDPQLGAVQAKLSVMLKLKGG